MEVEVQQRRRRARACASLGLTPRPLPAFGAGRRAVIDRSHDTRQAAADACACITPVPAPTTTNSLIHPSIPIHRPKQADARDGTRPGLPAFPKPTTPSIARSRDSIRGSEPRTKQRTICKPASHPTHNNAPRPPLPRRRGRRRGAAGADGHGAARAGQQGVRERGGRREGHQGRVQAVSWGMVVDVYVVESIIDKVGGGLIDRSIPSTQLNTRRDTMRKQQDGGRLRALRHP